MKKLCYAGVDLGSSAIKLVVLNQASEILGRIRLPTGLILEKSVGQVRAQLEALMGEEHQLAGVVSSGYGRHRVTWSQTTRSEIICHARGVFHNFPHACTVIDIGGQDNKVIHMDQKGHVARFRMNSKCAAGTGSFLEEVAARANLTMSQLHELALQSKQDTPVNSFCTVFAMTEVLKRIMGGEKLEDIARGIYISIAERIREIYRVSDKELVLTGGVIENNPIMVELLEQKLGHAPLLMERPQFSGALGAALFARELHLKEQKSELSGVNQ